MQKTVAAVLVLATLSVPVAAESLFGSRNSFGQEPQFLPVDEAFVFDALAEEDTITVTWRMPPGYYLYRHRLGVPGLDPAEIPEGLPKTDEIFGDVEVYYEGLTLTVDRSAIEGESMVISYQGCADAGLCYPPQKRTVSLD